MVNDPEGNRPPEHDPAESPRAGNRPLDKDTWSPTAGWPAAGGPPEAPSGWPAGGPPEAPSGWSTAPLDKDRPPERERPLDGNRPGGWSPDGGWPAGDPRTGAPSTNDARHGDRWATGEDPRTGGWPSSGAGDDPRTGSWLSSGTGNDPQTGGWPRSGAGDDQRTGSWLSSTGSNDNPTTGRWQSTGSGEDPTGNWRDDNPATTTGGWPSGGGGGPHTGGWPSGGEADPQASSWQPFGAGTADDDVHTGGWSTRGGAAGDPGPGSAATDDPHAGSRAGAVDDGRPAGGTASDGKTAGWQAGEGATGQWPSAGEAGARAEGQPEPAGATPRSGLAGWLPMSLGLLLIVLGAVWTLQGLDVLTDAQMSGQRLWAVIGPGVAAVGLILVVLGVRRRGQAKRRAATVAEVTQP